MLGVCIDILSDNLELADLRELLEEINYNRKLFTNFLINRLEEEIKKREERLLDNGCCPKCENELAFTDVYERHEVWGHNQVCKVGSVAKCYVCGWMGE